MCIRDRQRSLGTWEASRCASNGIASPMSFATNLHHRPSDTRVEGIDPLPKPVIADRPPPESGQAEFPHTAPALGACRRNACQDTGYGYAVEGASRRLI